MVSSVMGDIGEIEESSWRLNDDMERDGRGRVIGEIEVQL